MLKIALVGCGTIGTEIARAINGKFKKKARLVALCDKDTRQVQKLLVLLRIKHDLLSLDEAIKKSDLVIEAASGDIVAGLVKKCLKAKADIMVISIGGFIGHEDLFDLIENSRSRLYLPSGALCGLDAVKAAKALNIETAQLITRKPPESLKGVPFLEKRGIDVSQIDEETVVFSGSARQAIKAFPKNINVSALLSLAGIGAGRTQVKIITSPAFTTNSHQVIIEGGFGRVEALAQSKPSPNNPKTSHLASLSCIACLEQILSNVKLGT